jgi:hypothetical protein
VHSTPALAHLFQEELYAFTSPLVVILPKQWETYSTEEQSLLQKILTSVKVDLNAIQILVQPSVELKSLLMYSPARVLVFGCATREDIPLYSATAAQGFIVIRADDLTALDDQKKKNLWLALRQMFGI